MGDENMALHSPTKAVWEIIKCLSFLLVFILILSSLSILFLPKSNGIHSSIKNYLARGFYGEPRNSLDVIAIGNSNMESGFSPMELWRQYGVTGYTCGESCQTIFEAYNILSEVMSCQKPKVVILDTDGVFPLNDRMDTFYKFLNSTLDRLFPVIQYHSLWKSMRPDNIAQTNAYLWTSPTRGYLYNGEDKPFSGRRPQKHNPAVDRINAVTLVQLDAFRSLCQENGAQLVLVYVPTAFSWDQKRHDWMAEYAAKHNLPFLDLNIASNDFQVDWGKDTRDGGTHLNYVGAKKVTLYLGTYLRQHSALPDHREDPSFRRWNADYEKYLQMRTQPAIHPFWQRPLLFLQPLSLQRYILQPPS